MSSKSERKLEAREKARLMREEAERKRRRTRVLVATAAVVTTLVVVLGVGLAIRSAMQDDGQAGITATKPQGVGDKGQVTTGEDDAPVTVSVYLDFLCPACKSFEETNADLLASLEEEGAVKVEYFPVAILDNRSAGARYSTRSANAAYCVADQAPTAFTQFSQAMFTNQPQESGPGLGDDEISTIATLAGAPESVTDCIEDETYSDLVGQVTEQANQDGMPGTPWVLVQGEPLENWSSQNLQNAVTQALREVGGTVPTDTPTDGTPTDGGTDGGTEGDTDGPAGEPTGTATDS